MALVKITDLSNLNSGSSDFSADVFPIVDVNVDTTYKMTLNDLKGSLGVRLIGQDSDGGYITGSLTISGSIKSNIISSSVTYTAAVSDQILEFTGSSNTTCNLYTAVGNAGRHLVIKNSGTGIVTVDPDGSEIIDGQTQRTLAENEALYLMCDGVNEWHVINTAPIQIIMGHGEIDPADSVSYYIGQFLTVAPSITAGPSRRLIALKSGWITNVTAMISCVGTGTSEDSTFILRNITSGLTTTISTTVEHNTSSQLNRYSTFTPLRVTRGDSLEIEWDTPSWGSNPSGVRQVFNILIE